MSSRRALLTRSSSGGCASNRTSRCFLSVSRLSPSVRLIASSNEANAASTFPSRTSRSARAVSAPTSSGSSARRDSSAARSSVPCRSARSTRDAPRRASSLPGSAVSASANRRDASSSAPSDSARVRVGDRHLSRRGPELLQPGAHLSFRQRAGELGDLSPVLERLHSGDALDTERRRELRVRVDIELREDPLAAVFIGEPLEDGAERTTRRAPFGPEVDHYRNGLRAFENLGLEVGLIDLDDVRRVVHTYSNARVAVSLPARTIRPGALEPVLLAKPEGPGGRHRRDTSRPDRGAGTRRR